MSSSRSGCSQPTQSIKRYWSIYLSLLISVILPAGCAGTPPSLWDAPDHFSRASREDHLPPRANQEGDQRNIRADHRADQESPRGHASQLLAESGEAKVGHQMPFFSGWLTHGKVLNLTTLLKTKKSRYIITMCASWCAPCYDGLQRLSDARSRLQSADVKLVIYVIDAEVEAKKIQRRFNFDWALVLSDPFQSHARKLSSNKSPQQNKRGGTTIELPRTFVLNREGIITMIIGQEGHDYIERLLTERD